MEERRQLLDQTDIFHIGHAVIDIEAAMAELSEQFGVTWAPIMRRTVRAYTRSAGATEHEVNASYSRTGPVHVEVTDFEHALRAQAGDLVSPHHFGYWCDDIEATRDGLVADGWTLEVEIVAQDDYPLVPVIRSPWGYGVELVPRAFGPRVEAWIKG